MTILGRVTLALRRAALHVVWGADRKWDIPTRVRTACVVGWRAESPCHQRTCGRVTAAVGSCSWVALFVAAHQAISTNSMFPCVGGSARGHARHGARGGILVKSSHTAAGKRNVQLRGSVGSHDVCRVVTVVASSVVVHVQVVAQLVCDCGCRECKRSSGFVNTNTVAAFTNSGGVCVADGRLIEVFITEQM